MGYADDGGLDPAELWPRGRGSWPSIGLVAIMSGLTVCSVGACHTDEAAVPELVPPAANCIHTASRCR